jgi:hypothetical protein
VGLLRLPRVRHPRQASAGPDGRPG